MILHKYNIKTERHLKQWEQILGYRPAGQLVLDHKSYQQLRSKIEAIRPPVKEVRPAGRPLGSVGKDNKVKSTISLHKEDWDKLDEIGPSRGLAVSKLLKDAE